MEPLIELKNIYRRYPSGDEYVDVLKDINLTIHAGEMVAIMGASGSGKSTLMNLLGCLDKPSSGEYYFCGKNVELFSAEEQAELRRDHFGFIFQRYHLLPHLTAIGNVEIPAVYAGQNKRQRDERAKALLSRLGLGERLYYRPSQLSGGQQQRVSIARALMNGGQIILADEPTGALDSHSSQEVMSILKSLKEQGHTVIIVTHDPKVATQAERIIEISDGQIVGDSGQQTKALKQSIITEPGYENKHVKLRRELNSFLEALVMAWKAMAANKMRTILTMLGIIIGVASVVSIIVIGDAAQQQVLHDIKNIGTNTIEIYPGKDFGDYDPANQQALSVRDVELLKKQPYVDSVSPSQIVSSNINLGSTTVTANIYGVGEQFMRANGYEIEQGRGITLDSLSQRAQVVVIDHNTKNRLFPYEKNIIGKTIIISNIPSTIIGVTKAKNSRFGSSASLTVWIPYTTMQAKLTGQSWFSDISVRVKDGYSSQDIEKKIIGLLTLTHNKKDFFILNLDQILQTAQKTTQTLQLFLTLVAAIALIVGGIGVMNIMLVSVTERTREIGIRMAIGARAFDVLLQFLIEAIFVCLMGGFIGLILAFSIGGVVQLMMPNWHVVFSTTALLSAFFCATIIGIIFGFLPARRAAKLNPIDALARE